MRGWQQMSRAKVLILGSASSWNISELVTEAGFTPVVSKSLLDALKQVRSESNSAIVFDADNACTDLLEFTLNVRDIAPSVRIFVLTGEPGKEAEGLPLKTKQLFFMRAEDIAEKLRPAVIPVLDKAAQSAPKDIAGSYRAE